jgi:hypothetical protein
VQQVRKVSPGALAMLATSPEMHAVILGEGVLNSGAVLFSIISFLYLLIKLK